MLRTLVFTALALLVTFPAAADDGAATDDGWRALFDGESLDGWIPKFRGSELGVNYRETFRVADGVLQVNYDNWDRFGGEFGHLFFEEPFSHYRLRVEYRFVGEQVQDGPGWAYRNSGAMLYCQDPATMRVDQDFPVSIEVQLLGGDGQHDRSTANVCSPGTNWERDGELITQHCTNSTSRTYHGDQWVTLEIEVDGGEIMRNWIDGEMVFELSHPQLDPNDGDAKALIEAAGGEKLLTGGWISIQAESHPCEFRRIDILELD